ncbi:hypothetical protein IFM89_026687 [Coptis chinensis]|uniref:Uncharacterized protein n=1 Tax=Coptis chinensis TaxID=261450 RepID=A0A835H669_9MAGN|nr:hypothetical protein IFM89_026687 [Coptis chinensis]
MEHFDIRDTCITDYYAQITTSLEDAKTVTNKRVQSVGNGGRNKARSWSRQVHPLFQLWKMLPQGADAILANYPPVLPKRILSKVVPVFQVGVMGIVLGGEHIFPRLGYMTPPACIRHLGLMSLVFAVACASKMTDMKGSTSLGIDDSALYKEWDDALCPICTDHPHNVVLLLCSSFDNGCRPYICDSSFRHSNCLDRFKKYFRSGPSQPDSIFIENPENPRLDTKEGSEIMDVRNKDEVALGMKAAIASKQYGQEDILCPLMADVSMVIIC